MTTINGGAVLARSLNSLGVSEAFTLHGGHLDAFLVACKDNGIHLTDTRHEATAGYAAEAYARSTGNVGVCVITAGPGFTNGLTAIVNAWLDAMPVLFIAGSPPLREAALNPLQGGFDQIAMAAPVTKWAYRITNVERIPDIVDKAIRIARSGRPGPVFLEVPIDIMFGPMLVEDLVLPTLPALQTGPAPASEAVEQILALMSQAERPVILAGGGTLSRACAQQISDFASLTGTPVCFNTKANGVLPHGHPLNAGLATTLAIAHLKAKAPADLVIQLGARAGLFLGGRQGTIIPESAKLVQIDIDGAEIGRIRTPDVAVVADSTQALKALSAAARSRDWARRDAWLATLADCRQALTQPFEALPKLTDNGLLHPFHAAAGVAQALSPDTAISFDGGELTAWFQPHGRSPGPGLYMGNGYLGTLGVGQGYAIGMARACPGRPIATIIGDGAVGFHLGEFDTMARHRLPILTIIFNNSGWGLSRHGQELVFGKDRTAAVNLNASAYHTVAQGLGCDGELIQRYEQIAPAIERAQSTGRPTCLNVLTDPEVMHPNVPSMIGRVDAEDEIAIPYYENIRFAANAAPTSELDMTSRPVEASAQPTDGRYASLFEQGWCVVTDVLDAAASADVLDKLWRAAHEYRRRGNDTHIARLDPNASNVRVFDLLELDPVFRELIQHPQALEIVGALLGPDFLISNFTANIARPGSGSMSLHSDQALVVPEPWLQPWSINIIWCLTDVYFENGATLFIPGSQKVMCVADLGTDPTARLRPFEAKAGSIIAMDGRVWHTSGANVTQDKDRALLFGYYSRSFLRGQVNWNAVLSADVQAALDPKLRVLLGLDPSANVSVGRRLLDADLGNHARGR